MGSFLIRRLLAVLPVLLVVSLLVFFMLRLAPGDPAAVIAGNNATSEDIAHIRAHMGLDQPIAVQYVRWLSQVMQGDLGYSYYLSKPVTALVAQRLEPTVSLALGTVLLAVCVAVPLGSLAAWRMGGWLDRGLSAFSVAGFSVPVFVIAYLLIYVFAMQLQWLPVQGYKPLGGAQSQGVWAWLRQLILPWLTLSTVYVALIARITVLVRHALANAAVPIVTVVGIGVALLIGGVVVTETVFAIPGLGSLTVDAVLNRDFPVIQGLVLLFSLSYVLINLLVDSSYVWLDPRIRH
ncbi:MAG: ABC transporter permease [Betaproteobacteria bacterium]|nr:ABC transporter permease [Betaproteobacteria bacterium]